jgi:hypothetical protein
VKQRVVLLLHTVPNWNGLIDRPCKHPHLFRRSHRTTVPLDVTWKTFTTRAEHRPNINSTEYTPILEVADHHTVMGQLSLYNKFLQLSCAWFPDHRYVQMTPDALYTETNSFTNVPLYSERERKNKKPVHRGPDGPYRWPWRWKKALRQWRELKSSHTLRNHPLHSSIQSINCLAELELPKQPPQMFTWSVFKPGVSQMCVTRASTSPHRGNWTHFTALITAQRYNMTCGRVQLLTETHQTLTSLSEELLR